MCIITEYISGCTLREYLKARDYNIKNELRIKFTKQIAEALDYIHSKGVIHSDLTLNNIMVDLDENIKIIDFGLSVKCTRDNFQSDGLCNLHYEAPELRNRYNYKADLWSFGICIWYMYVTTHDSDSVGDYYSMQVYEYIKQNRCNNKIVDRLLQIDPSNRVDLRWIYRLDKLFKNGVKPESEKRQPNYKLTIGNVN